MKTLLLSFATLGLAVASAATSYKVTLFQPSIVAGKELQPGSYKVEVKDSTAIISKGKQSVEAPVNPKPAKPGLPARPCATRMETASIALRRFVSAAPIRRLCLLTNFSQRPDRRDTIWAYEVSAGRGTRVPVLCSVVRR